jgi:hypothetical protein
MTIGIIEIMPRGHYTLVDSVARIYASDPLNRVHIFTHQQALRQFDGLKQLYGERLTVTAKGDDESVADFFSRIGDMGLDAAYIITMDRYYKEFLAAPFVFPLRLFIHNIDEWFHTTLRYNLYHFFRGFSISAAQIYKFKTSFLYPSFRTKIAAKVLANGGRCVVLNANLKKELAAFIPANAIEVIPFSVYDPSLADASQANTKLRVCIPGMISETRRDYYSVLSMLDSDIEFFRDRIEMDFLGGISVQERGADIITATKRLIAKGMTIHIYEKPLVPLDEFDAQLAKADIILGNMNVVLDKYSTYGKTKETGIPFTMIRTAKPGIFPEQYDLLDELHSSSVLFKTYEDVSTILHDLAADPAKLATLKKEAQKNSLLFEPRRLYTALTSAR